MLGYSTSLAGALNVLQPTVLALAVVADLVRITVGALVEPVVADIRGDGQDVLTVSVGEFEALLQGAESRACETVGLGFETAFRLHLLGIVGVVDHHVATEQYPALSLDDVSVFMRNDQVEDDIKIE